jgi:mannosyltransferase OCH1-like enzyme
MMNNKNKHNYYFIIFFLILLFIMFLFNYIKFKEGFTESVIPLHIYQTWHTKDLPPKMKKCVETLKKLNPEFEHHLFDDNDCADFIKNNFDKDVYDAYNTLIPGAFKADLFRYCILYKKGGIYLDIKFYNVNGFKFIDLTDKEYYVRDIQPSGGGVYNALIVSKPNNPRLLYCINKIVENVKNKYYGEINGALGITGPLLLKETFTKDELENMTFTIGENGCPTPMCLYKEDQSKVKPIIAMYKEYRDEQKIYQKNSTYFDLWRDRNIYK